MILDFLERDKDGEPDFWVKLEDKEFDLECKRARGGAIDLMRTRAPKDWPEGRYYHPDEFQMIGACTFSEGRARFAFALTSKLPRHPNFPARLDNAVTVPDPPTGLWTDRIEDLFLRTPRRDQTKLDKLRALKKAKRAAARTPRRTS